MRGVRSAKSKHKNLLQPFIPLWVSWYGGGELKSLKTVESAGAATALGGTSLMSGLYLNELLVRLLRAEAAHHELFVFYRETLQALSLAVRDSTLVEPILRRFEYQLLVDLGYGFAFPDEVTADETIVEQQFLFSHDSEFVPVTNPVTADWRSRLFSGSALAAIARNDFSAQDTRREAKRLMRLALAPLLGDKPLRSRELFGASRIGK